MSCRDCTRRLLMIPRLQCRLASVLSTSQLPTKRSDFFNANLDGPADSFEVDSLRTGVIPHVKCSVIDLHCSKTSRTFRKAELCQQNGLQARDLRKIDSFTARILARKRCILIAILDIRALIKNDRVYIFDGSGRAHLGFIHQLHASLQQSAGSHSLPFEHRVLEIILAYTAASLENDLKHIRISVETLLATLEEFITTAKLRQLLALSKRLADLNRRSKLVNSAIDDVLENDEDLDALHLTSPRSLDLGLDHTEVEMMLETYSNQIEETCTALETLVSNVDQTREVTELILAASRNSLIALDLKVSIGTMALGVGAFIAALLGMNLATGFEDHPYAFRSVAGVSAVMATCVGLFTLKKLRKLRNIGLASPHYQSLPNRRSEWARLKLEAKSAKNSAGAFKAGVTPQRLYKLVRLFRYASAIMFSGFKENDFRILQARSAFTISDQRPFLRLLESFFKPTLFAAGSTISTLVRRSVFTNLDGDFR